MTMKDIPADLCNADELLTKYGLWAQDRHQEQHCASAEHRYRAPDWEPPPAPFIADFHAMDIHRTLQRVPITYRRVLQAIYIPKRLPPDAQRRKMRFTPSSWRELQLQGLRMFDNNWKLSSKNSKCSVHRL